MKSRHMILLALVLGPLLLGTQILGQQGDQGEEAVHYKFIDLGTFGGPASYFSEQGIGARVLNNHGDVAGYADTSTPDPSAPGCFNLDCFVSHAFRWHNGARIDLGAFFDSSAVSAINERGWIVGFSQYGPADPITGSVHAVAALWKNDQITSLGTLDGGTDSNAIDVNDRGQITGFASNSIPDPFDPFGFPTQLRAILWENGVMKDIGTLGGPDAAPSGINDRGLITGSSYINFLPNSSGFPTADPFLWENGNMIDLGSLGGTGGSGVAVNNRGQVVGQSNLPGDAETHAFLWDHGILTDLRTLGGSFSMPTQLNEAGEVIGSSTTQGDQAFLAFLWKDGTMRSLGTVDGDSCSQANSINARGQVVGISAVCDFSVQHAFLWENGRMTDLNTLIPSNSNLQLSFAADINDRGEIVGVGVPTGVPANPDLFGHLFVLIPCDAPHSHEQGCKNSAEGAETAPQPNLAPVGSAAVNARSQHPLTATEIAAWRFRLTRRNHFPVVGTRKN
jgi:probable HAF family extracellular repeat protein